jgi:large subunit ribosomal protein L24
MKTKFSKSWNRSDQSRKQRKYRYNAPLHIRQKYATSILSKELRKKLNKRSIMLKKGDSVKVMRGQFKKKTGKVEEIDLGKIAVYVSGIEAVKKDGTKSRVSLNPSNLMIIEANLDDKMRNKGVGGNKHVKPS